MLPRARPAAHRLAALSKAHPISTGHLLADCERWCRDHLAPRTVPTPRTHSERLASAAQRPPGAVLAGRLLAG